MRGHQQAAVLLLLLSASAGAAAPDRPGLAARGETAILGVALSAPAVPRCGLMELTVRITASYDNPYDPEQVELVGVFTGPSGKPVAVPGFLYQDFRRPAGDPQSPYLERVGEPSWRIRFAPAEVGPYSCTVRLRNRFQGQAHEAAAPAVRFRCTASSSPGFIRVVGSGKGDARYFTFDSGAPFFPVGQNVQNDWTDYRHTQLLAQGGANCARPWMFCHWTWLEWTNPKADWARPGHWILDYGGAGDYNQGLAWLADDYLRRCEHDGIHLMICLGAAHELGEGSSHDRWAGHPYNRANGGFLDRPEDYWSDARARALARNRLRYIAARWGYSTAVWAWEFWNELGDAGPAVAAWHQEMASYLWTVDPNHHLRTTSTWQPEPDALAPIWRLPGIDFTQSHTYLPSPALQPTIEAFRRRYGKPHVIGEGGGLPGGPGQDDAGRPCSVDPEGIDFHNSLWLPAMAGAAGGTLPWHWRQRIEPGKLSGHYGALARFLAGLPAAGTRPADVTLRPEGTPERRLSPVLVVPLGAAWGKRAGADHFAIGPDGSVAGLDVFTHDLFGAWRPEWRRPPTFTVRYLADGRFIVHVGESCHSILTISLDGKEVLREGRQEDRSTLDRDFGIAVPAGEHEICVDNAGGDWLEAQYYVLTNVRDAARTPDLEAYGLQTGTQARLWFRNRLNEWAFRAAGVPLEPAGPATATLRGLRPGAYRIRCYDTKTGAVFRSEAAKAPAGALQIRVPVVERDVACSIEPIR